MDIDRNRVLLEIHRIFHDFISRGDVEALIYGVSIDTILHRLENIPRDTIVKILESLERDGSVVLYRVNGRVERIKPIQIEVIMFLLSLPRYLPYVDAKLMVIPRRHLKVANDTWFDELVRSTKLSQDEVKLLSWIIEQFIKFINWIKKPYLYQVDAWKQIFPNAVSGRFSKAIAILAGTGEGKTEAFFIPLLLAIAIAKLRGLRMRAVILYPRKALAEEQMNRFIKYVYLVNKVLRAFDNKRRGKKSRIEPITLGILDRDTPLTWIWIRKIERNILCPFTEKEESIELSDEEKERLEERDLELVLKVCEEARIDYTYLERLQERLSMLRSRRRSKSNANISKPPRFYCKSKNEVIDWIIYTKTDFHFTKPDILITNFESLSIRLQDPSFREFWKDVAFVVIDEAHELYGLRGVHGALITRRLLARVQLESSRKPMLIISSATMANPERIVKAIDPNISNNNIVVINASRDTYREVEPYEYSYHLFLVPSENVTHETATTVISTVLAIALKNHKVLIFTNSRTDAERLARYVAKRSEEWDDYRLKNELKFTIVSKPEECIDDKPCLVSIHAHRLATERGLKLETAFHHAGLKKTERTRVEQDFKSSNINVVAATSTLELGIDIGDIDAVVMHGFPFTSASYLQRAGRAGARGREPLHPIIVTVVDASNPHDVIRFARAEDIVMGQDVESSQLFVDPELNIVAMAQQGLAALLDYAVKENSRASLSPSTLAILSLDPAKAVEGLNKASLEYIVRALNIRNNKVSNRIISLILNSVALLRKVLEVLKSHSKSLELIKLSALRAWTKFDEEQYKGIEVRISEAIEELTNEIGREFRALGFTIDRLTKLIDLIRMARDLVVEKLVNLGVEKLRELLALEALIRLLDEIKVLRTDTYREVFEIEKSYDIAYTNVLRALELAQQVIVELLSAIVTPTHNKRVDELRRNLEIINVPLIVGKRSIHDVVVKIGSSDYIVESLLDAYIHYPPGHQVVRGDIIYEAQYYEADLISVDVSSDFGGYMDYDYELQEINGIVYPRRIDLVQVQANAIPIGKRKFKPKTVYAFGWVDDNGRYIEYVPKEKRVNFKSVDMVFVCRQCLSRWISNWFKERERIPFFYPFENGDKLARLPRTVCISRCGSICMWYPLLTDNSKNIIIPKCPNCKTILKAVTPLRILPVTVDVVVDTVKVSEIYIDKLKLTNGFSTIVYIIDRLRTFIDGIPRTIKLVHNVGAKKYPLGYMFKSNSIGIGLASEISREKLEELWEVPAIRWKYLYHRLLGKVRDLLRIMGLEDADPRFVTDIIIALLRIVTICIGLRHGMDVDDLMFIARNIIRSHIMKNKISIDREYRFRTVLFALLYVLSDALSDIFKFLDRKSMEEALSENMIKEIFGEKSGKDGILSRYGNALLEIANEYRKIVVNRRLEDPKDFENFVKFTIMHTFAHVLTRYIVATRSISLYDVKTSCGSLGLNREVSVYEFCEGGSGILTTFFEHLQESPEKELAKVIGWAAECPRERYGYYIDVLLDPSNILELIRSWRSKRLEGLRKSVRKLLACDLSLGTELKIINLLNRFEDLVGAMIFRYIVLKMKELIGLEPRPIEISYVYECIKTIFHDIARDKKFMETMKQIFKIYGKEFSMKNLKELFKQFLAKPRIEVPTKEEETEGVRKTSKREVDTKRIAILLEEYAPMDVDGCSTCVHLPYCIHQVNVKSLTPYLSKTCLKLLV